MCSIILFALVEEVLPDGRAMIRCRTGRWLLARVQGFRKYKDIRQTVFAEAHLRKLLNLNELAFS